MAKKPPVIPTFRSGPPSFSMGVMSLNQSVKKRADDFYRSKEWRHFCAKLDRERPGRACDNPKCEDPHAHGRRYWDHIKELKDGGAPLDPSNAQRLCASCHSTKTYKERVRRFSPGFHV